MYFVHIDCILCLDFSLLVNRASFLLPNLPSLSGDLIFGSNFNTPHLHYNKSSQIEPQMLLHTCFHT